MEKGELVYQPRGREDLDRQRSRAGPRGEKGAESRSRSDTGSPEQWEDWCGHGVSGGLGQEAVARDWLGDGDRDPGPQRLVQA